LALEFKQLPNWVKHKALTEVGKKHKRAFILVQSPRSYTTNLASLLVHIPVEGSSASTDNIERKAAKEDELWLRYVLQLQYLAGEGTRPQIPH
jgi:hypothetical protein